MTKIQRDAIRNYILNEIGADLYRITRDGEVHAYGQMPNSVETGWWLFGQSVADALTRIEHA